MARAMTMEETVRRGEQIFSEQIRANIGPESMDHYVAIDVVSGDYVISQSSVEATDAIHVKRPNAIVALLRVGYDTGAAIGASLHRRDETGAA